MGKVLFQLGKLKHENNAYISGSVAIRNSLVSELPGIPKLKLALPVDAKDGQASC